MVYINADGTASDTPKKKKWGISLIADFVFGVFDLVGMFFRTLTASPAALESERVSRSIILSCRIQCFLPVRAFAHLSKRKLCQGQRRTTYAERQGVRGGGGGGGRANIRGVSRLGAARAAAGG